VEDGLALSLPSSSPDLLPLRVIEVHKGADPLAVHAKGFDDDTAESNINLLFLSKGKGSKQQAASSKQENNVHRRDAEGAERCILSNGGEMPPLEKLCRFAGESFLHRTDIV